MLITRPSGPTPAGSDRLSRPRWQRVLCAVLVACSMLPAWADPWGPRPPGAPGQPRPPTPFDRSPDRGRTDDTARQRQWQEQQQREARERSEHHDRSARGGRDERHDPWQGQRRDDRWDDRWDRRWDNHMDRWYGPTPGRVVVVPPPPPRRVVRPRYGVVVPVLPWAATVLVVGTATYWYCDGVYYRRLPSDAGYQVVDEPMGNARVLDERMYVYPRKGQSAEQQARDEYDCHRWAVDQTGFDPTAAATGDVTDLDRRDDYRRAQTACLDGRGYNVK